MNKIKTTICTLLCIFTLLSFSSCKEAPPSAMTLGGASISEGVYKYKLCSHKAQFLSTYSDMSDTDEFWDQMLTDDMNAEEFLTNLANDYVKMDLISIYLFDEYGMKTSAADKKAASDIISDLKEVSGGDKKSFEKILSQYGVDEKTLLQIYLDEYKTTYVYNYVFENGIINVGDSEKQEFLEENYVRIRHIYINNSYNYDESYYDDDGNFIKVALSEEEQAKKDAKIEKVRKALADGDDFDSVYEKYSEETAYKYGYYLSSKTEDLPSELIVSSFTLDVGETLELESEYGTHFIKRLEMDEGAWKSSANEDFFGTFKDDVYESEFVEFMRSYFDMIEVNDDIISKYSIREVLPNWSYQY